MAGARAQGVRVTDCYLSGASESAGEARRAAWRALWHMWAARRLQGITGPLPGVPAAVLAWLDGSVLGHGS